MLAMIIALAILQWERLLVEALVVELVGRVLEVELVVSFLLLKLVPLHLPHHYVLAFGWREQYF
jgi:hypothetical protein